VESHTAISQLTPGNCIFILVNYQTKLAFTINSKDQPALINNAVRLAKIAKAFEIPVILTTIGAATFGGPLLSPLQMVFPDQNPFNCDKLSIWENTRVSAALKKTARKKIVMAGLWTNFTVALSAIQALHAGYQVYIASDACAELSDIDNDSAVQRMIEAGAVSLDSSQILLHFETCEPSHYMRNRTSDLIREITYS